MDSESCGKDSTLERCNTCKGVWGSTPQLSANAHHYGWGAVWQLQRFAKP